MLHVNFIFGSVLIASFLYKGFVQKFTYKRKLGTLHWIKRAQTRGFFWCEYEKIQIRKTPILSTFQETPCIADFTETLM